MYIWSFNSFFKKYLFLERGEGRRKGGKRNMNVLWEEKQTQASALTGNRTCDLSVHRLALSPLSHTSQGCHSILIIIT